MTSDIVADAAIPIRVKKSSFYRPELDCLRFFAFLAVFVHHSIPKTPDFFIAHHLPPWLSNVGQGGAYGVDLFFCLSAFLITELLLREKDQVGHLNVKAFYIRRMLRIWPLYFAFVLFAFGLTFVDRTQHFSVTQLLMFLMLAGNWAAGTTVMQSVVAPLWSVSIEEQFYLLWPLAVGKASRKHMLMICIFMVGIAFAWRALLQSYKPSLIWNSTFSHLDSISYGILLSLLGFRKQIPTWVRLGLLSAGMSAWFYAGGIHGRDDLVQAFAALGSVAILRAVVGMKLDHPVLVRLGVVSYGLYVYHEFFLNYWNRILPSRHGWGFVLWWLLAFSCTTITALASYRWLESPFLRLKERFTVVKSRPV
jgi:peptidoglycan/LPS O-acetylase OafA/YrhL